jgi:hypothetical protein
MRSLVGVALASVLAVSGVPGFAQTNTANEHYRSHSSLSVARVYVPVRSTVTDFEFFTVLPSNITVTSLYHQLLSRMLGRSETFRQQCARLGRAHNLTIEIKTEIAARRDAPRAWTYIVRSAGDRLHATVTVPPTDRPAELIAHEFEHVLEQLDGVDLAALSRVRRSGVRECECGHVDAFETTRAIKTGLRVSLEVGESGP